MRKTARLLACLLPLGGPVGCDRGSGSGSSKDSAPLALAATAPPSYLSPSEAVAQAGLRDAVGPAGKGGGADGGRVLFDGARSGGESPGSVAVPPGGKEPSPAYTGEGRKDTLRILEPPSPGATSATAADFSGVKFDPALGDGEKRREILSRTEKLLGVPYKFGGDSDKGRDCSAFVSRAWGIDRHGTATMHKASYKITKDELEPGDALNLTIQNSQTGYGHIRLFVGWASADKSEMWIAEASGPGLSAYRKVKYSKAYQPIRRKDLPRRAGMADKSEELSRPRILVLGDSHSTGAFGSNLDKRLRETFTGSLVETYASCGSSPFWFLPGSKHSGKASHCGTFVSNYDESGSGDPAHKVSRRKAKTPMLRDVLRPETAVVIVELGANSTASAELMAETIASVGARCVWIGVPLSGAGGDLEAAKSKQAAKNADLKRKTGAYCDFIESKMERYEGSDGAHYSSDAAARWSEQVFGDLKDLLGRYGAQ